MTKSRLFNDTPYLAFAPHDTQVDAALDMPKSDVETLRGLACKVAEIAALPVQDSRKKAWADINDLRGGKPVVWINEICWHEMNVNGELTNLCENEVAQRIETQLRRTLYQWNHLQGDMVVERTFFSPYIVENTGFGISVDAEVAESHRDSTIASRKFHNQFAALEDVEKIKTPIVTHRADRTEAFYETYRRIFDGIMPVEKRGCTGFWFAPWDDIVFWMSAEEVLYRLADDPDLMLAIIDRLVTAYNSALDQLIALGIVASNNLNVRIGSGGYGYTNDLPPEGDRKQTKELWGSATPQIFGSVSPAMHEEFGIDYENRWLSRFGLNYYGCCEPLHNKLDILAKVPNLRKISISPWANVAIAAEGMRGKYAMSLKPSPSCLAFDHFDEELARRELREKLAAAKGCCVEVILKDISTVRFEPQRLWRWAQIASEVTKEFA